MYKTLDRPVVYLYNIDVNDYIDKKLSLVSQIHRQNYMGPSENSKKQITARDIAKYANVSIATVSRVINNSTRVSETTRQRVKETIQAFQYQPSRTAQRLRAKRSQVIGLIITDIENPFFTSVVRGIEDAAYQNDYSVVLCNSDEDIDKEKLYIDVMCGENMAGVIITPASENPIHFQKLLESSIPLVTMDRSIPDTTIDSVTVDNEFGAYQAVVHLIQLGHRQIGFIGHPSKITTGIERKSGYLNALLKHGIPANEVYLCEGDMKQKGGYECTKRLIQTHPQISALFVSNNLMTLGAIGAITELGLKIPDDISIVGFDDMPWAPYLNPPLTAVAQPTYELGRQSAELLLRRINQPDKKATGVQLKTSLIIRSSTSAPRNNYYMEEIIRPPAF